MTVSQPASRSELTRLSAVQMRRLIAAGQITPVEALDGHIAVIERLNPQFNAVVTLDAERARAFASAMKPSSSGNDLLYGLPVLIKDVTQTAGIRTTFGSKLFEDFVPETDDLVVSRLKDAGAIIFGKTNTPEFATGANTVNEVFGTTRNPWNPDLSPAGSSGGSAVAVATGMAPLAQGTDYGCSIRIPASFCGIVGVRPTGGLIPNKDMKLPWDFGYVQGPLARNVEDAALMLDAMKGLDPLWPISAAPPWASALEVVERTENARGVRVAYARDIASLGVDPAIDDICQTALRQLERDGATVETIEFNVSEGFDAYKTLRSEWMVGQHFLRLAMLDRFGPNLRGNIEDGLKLSVRDTAAAESIREEMWARFCSILGRFDVLVTPAAPVLPYPVTQPYPTKIGERALDNYIDWVAPAFLVTLVGFPAVSVPAGLSKSTLPVGLQIVGPRFSEPKLLALAKLIHRNANVGWPTFAS